MPEIGFGASEEDLKKRKRKRRVIEEDEEQLVQYKRVYSGTPKRVGYTLAAGLFLLAEIMKQ